MNGPEDAPPRRRPLALLSSLAAILLWQAVFLLHAQPQSTLGTSYALQASDGVPRRHADFVYFLHYLWDDADLDAIERQSIRRYLRGS